jgi:hypothetical protein
VALAGECGWLPVEGDRSIRLTRTGRDLVNDQHNPERRWTAGVHASECQDLAQPSFTASTHPDVVFLDFLANGGQSRLNDGELLHCIGCLNVRCHLFD